MNTIILSNGKDGYHQDIDRFCTLFQAQVEPYVLIHNYHAPTHIPMHTRMTSAFKLWRIMRDTKYLQAVIYITDDIDTHFLAHWFWQITNQAYKIYRVHTMAEAHRLADKLIARQGR